MKNKKTLSILIIFSIIGLFLFTGCGNKEEDGNYEITGSGLNSLPGVYELFEVKGDGTSYTGKEWTSMTTIDKILNINDDNTATILMTYKNSTTDEVVQETEKYTYDDNAFYGVESDNTKEGVKYFTYEFNEGKISLTVVGDSHNSVYVFKKK